MNVPQGPCADNEWLVASKIAPSYYYSVANKKIKVSCKTKPCPCLKKDPDFCEVLMKSQTECKKCQVALAAEQDGLCGRGQQLFNSPFGFGVCGCRSKPRH